MLNAKWVYMLAPRARTSENTSYPLRISVCVREKNVYKLNKRHVRHPKRYTWASPSSSEEEQHEIYK